jgi:hypothetical protein
MNPLEQFAEECLCLTESSSDRVASGRMLECYRSWCRQHQIRHPVSPPTFKRAMAELGCVYSHTKTARLWTCVKLTPEGHELANGWGG